jgi:hypothetical protein
MGIKVKIKKKIDEENKAAEKPLFSRESLSDGRELQKAKEIETSLSEIYQDSEGRKIDVNRMKIRRKQGLVFWFFNILIFCLVAIVIGFGAYYYIIYGKGTDATAVNVNIDAPSSVSAGQEFTYTINYNNQEYVALKNAGVSIEYPKNFIFISADPAPDQGNNSWSLERINSRSSGKIVVKGKIIDQVGSSAITLIRFLYAPENFSSEFKKDSSFTTVIRDVGFDTVFDYSNAALVNQQQDLTMAFDSRNDNFLPDFIIRLVHDNNVQLGDMIVDGGASGVDSGNQLKVEKIKDNQDDLWLVSGLQNERGLEIKYKLKNKIADSQNLKITFEESVGGKNYVFLAKDLPLEVMKSDLNLNLILNGSNNDQAVDFGQKLNYSIAYANKGEGTMKDVMIMAVLDSDFLDWTTLGDNKKGREMGDTITWTKDEIPALANIGVDQEGTIDFSINVLPFRESDLGKNFKITAYAQYSVGGSGGTLSSSTLAMSTDNRGNTIISAINSDLNFKEEVRYFDENNLPVGNGPLPPQVGEKTSFKVYWDLTNNLHDLNDVKLETVLPANVNWDEHNRTSVGTISYDNVNRKVTWQIGRLPITVFRADAEFNIGVSPTEDDRNKIIVLLNGSEVVATDAKTGANLERKSLPKTSKLEDDNIANMSSDGRVK